MQRDDNPTEPRRTESDRLTDAPALLWIIIGVAAAAVFLLLLTWLGSHPA